MSDKTVPPATTTKAAKVEKKTKGNTSILHYYTIYINVSCLYVMCTILLYICTSFSLHYFNIKENTHVSPFFPNNKKL